MLMTAGNSENKQLTKPEGQLGDALLAVSKLLSSLQNSSQQGSHSPFWLVWTSPQPC